MDSIENSIRILQRFCRDSMGNYIGIPQGVYMEIHGNPMGILQGFLKDNSFVNLQRNDEEFLRVLWFLRNVSRDSLMNPTGVLKGS